MKILAAMSAVQSALSTEGISKANRNQQQGYNFRGIDDCYNAVSGLFARNRILPVPSYTDIKQEERASSNGKAIFVTRLLGMFEFVSMEDGTKIVAGPFPGEAMDTADKSTNKAMSASFKYALMQVFTIPTVGDNDADATTHEVAGRDRQVDRGDQPEQRKSALVGENIPVGENGVRQKRGPSDGHPIMLQLEAALNKYGDKRATFEKKTAEAMGVGSIYDIPPKDLPQALLKVIEHQKAAKASKDAKGDDKPAGKPAGRKPAGRKPAPLPDDEQASSRERRDADDEIPV